MTVQVTESGAFAAGQLSGVSLSLVTTKLAVQAGEPLRVAVSLANGSAVTLGAYRWWHQHPMLLGYLWTERSSGQQLPADYVLTEIWRPIDPGQHRIVHMRVRTPSVPGAYILSILLMQQGVRWYDFETEVKPVQLEVEVREKLAVLPHAINDYDDSVFSQNGEDGILRELFLRLGYADPFAVEFGVGDGMECNTAMWLRHYGWRGLLLEGDPADCARIKTNYRDYPGVTAGNEMLTVDNAVETFQRYGVPKEFDLLSIDIDGNDYWLWEALGAEYRPRVVVIENNRTFAPPRLWVMAYNPDHAWNQAGNRNYCGASLESLARLGKRLGYALLGTDANDINAFFVRADLLARSRFPELTASEAYHTDPYRWPAGWVPNYDGPFVEQ